MSLTWGSHGVHMGLKWDSNGTQMGLKWGSHGAYMHKRLCPSKALFFFPPVYQKGLPAYSKTHPLNSAEALNL
jgi:hypothetical protein